MKCSEVGPVSPAVPHTPMAVCLAWTLSSQSLKPLGILPVCFWTCSHQSAANGTTLNDCAHREKLRPTWQLRHPHQRKTTPRTVLPGARVSPSSGCALSRTHHRTSSCNAGHSRQENQPGFGFPLPNFPFAISREKKGTLGGE